MSSYKGHSIFAFIVSLTFFQNPLLIALTLISANVPDFDHEFKKDSVYKMIILGLVLFICLYMVNLPYFLGLIIIFLGLIFHFSNHRSFTHSIFGVLTLTASLTFLLIFTLNLANCFTHLNAYIILMMLAILLGFIFLNKNVLMIFIPLSLLSLFFIPITSISYTELISALFLGLLSHVILDSFTPAGVKIFAPLSSKKVFKKFGISMIVILLLFAFMFRLSLKII